MSHFAQIDENNIVTRVIVVEQDFINSGILGDPSKWIQTSYNTYLGQHLKGGVPMRKNFAVAGYIYDKQRDAFYAPQPYPSWKLDEETCIWKAPVPLPDQTYNYSWNEQKQHWEKI